MLLLTPLYLRRSVEFSTGDFAPGKMNLGSIGLHLFSEVVDKASDTHCFVCLNERQITDGDHSNVVVVVFRGTVSRENMRTDLDWEQVKLPSGGQGWADVSAKGMGEKKGSAAWSGYGSLLSTDSEGDLERRSSPVPIFSDDNPISMTPDSDLFEGVSGSVRVHKGFRNSYGKIRNRIMRSVLDCVENSMLKSGKPPKVYVTGHRYAAS